MASKWARDLAKRITAAFEAVDEFNVQATTGEQDYERANSDRARLVYAVSKVVPSSLNQPAVEGLDGASESDVAALMKALARLEVGLQKVADKQPWPLVIEPSGPPRDEWEQTADVADGDIDDEPLGEYTPRGGFLSTTFGKVAAGFAALAVARWVLK